MLIISRSSVIVPEALGGGCSSTTGSCDEGFIITSLEMSMASSVGRGCRLIWWYA